MLRFLVWDVIANFKISWLSSELHLRMLTGIHLRLLAVEYSSADWPSSSSFWLSLTESRSSGVGGVGSWIGTHEWSRAIVTVIRSVGFGFIISDIRDTPSSLTSCLIRISLGKGFFDRQYSRKWLIRGNGNCWQRSRNNTHPRLQISTASVYRDSWSSSSFSNRISGAI